MIEIDDAVTGRPDVVVVGAGVIGLTTGVRLAEHGLRVHLCDATSPGSASAAAGAIWDPLYAHHPLVTTWAHGTHDEFVRMAGDGVPGVRLVEGVEASRTRMELPEWSRMLPGFRECRAPELPDGFATGWRYVAPIIDMPPYLGYLRERLRRAGGEIECRRVRSLDEVLAAVPVVVNCSGMGARDLVPDPEVVGVRGQLVAVRNPGIAEFFVEQNDGMSESTYFLPQGDVLLLGGSAEPDRCGAAPDEDVARAIVARCAAIVPAIGHAQVLGHRVGIRPHRPTVRVEGVTAGDGYIVHNYGHGGSGVSLSWGCADDVVRMVTGARRLASEADIGDIGTVDRPWRPTDG